MKAFFRRRAQKINPFPEIEIAENKGVRTLHLGNSVVQSAMRLKDPFALELAYTQAMFAWLPFLPTPRRILMVGLGGGSIAKFIYQNLPDIDLTVVEINPQVVQAARQYFLVPENNARFRVVLEDGAAYVATRVGRFDAILLDGYNGLERSPELMTNLFYSDCLRALRPNGCLVFNLWGSHKHFGHYIEEIGRLFAGVAGHLPPDKDGNVVAFGFKQAPQLPPQTVWEQAQRLENRLGLPLTDFCSELANQPLWQHLPV